MGGPVYPNPARFFEVMAPKKSIITIVHSTNGDWVGLYVNGRLLHEASSISIDDGLTLLGMDFTKLTSPLLKGERLPLRLENVV